MGTDTVRAILRGVNDNVNNTLELKRPYFFFKDGEVTGGNTVHLFLAAYDSMDSWPSVAVGTTLLDALGAPSPVNDVLIQGSADNVTYYDGAATGAHWTVTIVPEDIATAATSGVPSPTTASGTAARL